MSNLEMLDGVFCDGVQIRTGKLPFGDPCPLCGAGSAETDERDRVCVCEPCPVCIQPSCSICAYCNRSLGCSEHRVSIERHVEVYCLATPEQRAKVESLKELDPEYAIQIQNNAPRPWPPSLPPFDRAVRSR